MGVGRLPLAIPGYVLIVIGKELCYCRVTRLLAHRLKTLAADLVGRIAWYLSFDGANGVSAWGSCGLWIPYLLQHIFLMVSPVTVICFVLLNWSQGK